MKYTVGVIAISGLFLMGCSGSLLDNSSGESSSSTSISAQKAQFNANAYDMTQVVCNGDSPNSPAHGLLAKLYIKPSGAPDLSDIAQIENAYHQSEQNLFFNSLNEPTRIFDTGFITASGDEVTDDEGTPLIENFGLVFTSQFELAVTDLPGSYEFSLLADDGASFEIQDDSGNWQMIVNDDGLHPTQMGCSHDSANPIVSLQQGHIYNIRAHYFQGPRYEIANVLMWRKVADGATSVARDPLCGQNGNYLYFDPDHGSQPLQAYASLIGRGWSVVPAMDFYLPTSDLSAGQNYNPCFTTDSPQITDMHIVNLAKGTIQVQWTTDRPATGQIIVKNIAGDTIGSSVSDNLLTTDHIETLSLPVNSAFDGKVQAVSFSENQGMSMSAPIPFHYGF